MKFAVLPSACLLCLLLAAGCATPQTRIERHPETFAAFPPEVQQDVREGIIRLGFAADMVLLAVGKPDHVQQRVDAAGRATVWRYTAYRWRHRAHRWPYRHGPWWHDSFYWEDRQEYDVLRVEFRDGKVVALEHRER